jgi:hypothetical protein
MKKKEIVQELSLRLYSITCFGELDGIKQKFTVESYAESAYYACDKACDVLDANGIQRRSGYRIDCLGTLFNFKYYGNEYTD